MVSIQFSIFCPSEIASSQLHDLEEKFGNSLIIEFGYDMLLLIAFFPKSKKKIQTHFISNNSNMKYTLSYFLSLQLSYKYIQTLSYVSYLRNLNMMFSSRSHIFFVFVFSRLRCLKRHSPCGYKGLDHFAPKNENMN